MRPFLLLLLLLPASLSAQSTQADLEAKLLHKTFYLRGLWASDKLKFDSAGKLKGSSNTAPFTVSGIEIDQLELSSKELTLTGQRVGLVFDKDGFKQVPMTTGPRKDPKREEMRLKIDGPAGTDFAPALDAVLTSDLGDLIPAMPDFWQSYANRHFVIAPVQAELTPAAAKPPLRVGGGVTPPKVLNAPEPDFNEYARVNRISGNVLIYLQVGKDGLPDHIRILRPTGMGLDEQAVAAVKRYRFAPAQENGEPVRVEMNVVVNFQIF